MFTDTLEIEEAEKEDNLVSIRDAARIIGVPPHTIRYWEKEFAEFLNPPRTTGKQRRYGDLQIDRLRAIYAMLKEDGYSIAGARRALSQRKDGPVVLKENPALKGTTLAHFSSDVAEKILALVKHELHYQF